MATVIIDPAELRRLIRERRECGGDRYDEVWDGVYVMSPLADNQHQQLATKFAGAIDQAMGDREEVQVFAGTNVSDRDQRWKRNFRCPDVAVFLPGNPAQDRGSHWFGGPDFAVEIISPYDRSRKKFAFYAKVNVRELLLVARRPWCLELYRLRDGKYELVGKSDAEQPAVLASEVLPLTFRLIPGEPRPRIEVARTDGTQRWLA
jgi:Uma2 family endonuclease